MSNRLARLAPLLALLLIAACGDKSVRYLVEPTPAPRQVALRVASIEVADMVLPEYAEAPDVLLEGKDGGLKPVKHAIWADGTAPALSGKLVVSLTQRSTARIASEPWPLSGYPDARLEVRVAEMVARASGSFDFSGQYALSSPDRRVAEVLAPFSVSVPLAGTDARSIAAAKGAAIDALADLVVKRLARGR